MGIVIGGNGYNVSRILDERERQAALLGQYAREATARNDAQAQNSVRLANGRDQARDHLDNVARQQQAQDYARQQDVLAQQRNDQNFQRQGEWHDQGVQRDDAVFERQDKWHKDDMARRLADQVRDDAQFEARQKQQKELAEASGKRMDARIGERALLNTTEDVFKELPALPYDVAHGVAKRWLGQEPAPEMRPEEASMLLPELPDEPGTMSIPPSPIDDAVQRISAQRTERNKKQVHDQTMERERLDMSKGREERIAQAEKQAYEDKQKYRNGVARVAEMAAQKAVAKGRDPNDALDLLQAYHAGVPPNWQDSGALVAEAQRLASDSQKAFDDDMKAFPPNLNVGHQYPRVMTPEQALRKAYPGHGSERAADAIMKIEEVREKLNNTVAPALDAFKRQEQAPVQDDGPVIGLRKPIQAPPPPKGVTTAAPGAEPVTAANQAMAGGVVRAQTPPPAPAQPLQMTDEEFEALPVLSVEEAKAQPNIKVFVGMDGKVYRR
jgi:hypothetical protein